MTMLNKKTVKISLENSKMGQIPSVSVPAIITCRYNAPCTKGCYACKGTFNWPNAKNAYSYNLDLYRNDPKTYFESISKFCWNQLYFRWHVSGDIVDAEYLKGMIKVAKENKHCKFLCFTKKYELINKYLETKKFPKNLIIILSNWYDWKCENPNNLPSTNVIDKVEDIKPNQLLCGGNCSDCCCRGVGCWQLKKGQELVFLKH